MTNHEPKHPPADMAGLDGLIERLREDGYSGHNPLCLEAADRLEALEAENERLNSLINDTANHWLRLQCDHPIVWEGAIDTAMEAACDEIRHLSAALGEKQ